MLNLLHGEFDEASADAIECRDADAAEGVSFVEVAVEQLGPEFAGNVQLDVRVFVGAADEVSHW
jgi:hypothetical protein